MKRYWVSGVWVEDLKVDIAHLGFIKVPKIEVSGKNGVVTEYDEANVLGITETAVFTIKPDYEVVLDLVRYIRYEDAWYYNSVGVTQAVCAEDGMFGRVIRDNSDTYSYTLGGILINTDWWQVIMQKLYVKVYQSGYYVYEINDLEKFNRFVTKGRLLL